VSGAPWFGELYLATTADLLTPGLSALEAEVIASLLGLAAGERALDAGCGHGRHLAVMEGRGLRLVGVDRSREYLGIAARLATATSSNRRGLGPRAGSGIRGLAPPEPPARFGAGSSACACARHLATPLLVQADVRDLPFGPVFDAAWSWYSSLFHFGEEGNREALRSLGRALRPGGRLVVQHANPLALAREPVGRARRVLAGGARVEEVARFDAARGRERLARRLTRRGRVLAGSCTLRYYSPDEWQGLARDCGFGPPRLAATGRGGVPAPFTEEAIDLIAVLEKPT